MSDQSKTGYDVSSIVERLKRLLDTDNNGRLGENDLRQLVEDSPRNQVKDIMTRLRELRESRKDEEGDFPVSADQDNSDYEVLPTPPIIPGKDSVAGTGSGPPLTADNPGYAR